MRWAGATRRLPTLTFPHRRTRSSATLDQEHRLRLLNSCFQQHTAPVAHRVAAILLLLYAQPVARISRLRTTDIRDNGNDMAITFDTDAVPVPPPIAQLLRQHLGDRPNMQTAANPASPWLFPGLWAGQPLTADRMNHQLRNLGIPLRQDRNSALRQLVQDMPPAVAPKRWATARTSSNTTTNKPQFSSTATPLHTATPGTRPDLAEFPVIGRHIDRDATTGTALSPFRLAAGPPALLPLETSPPHSPAPP